MALAINDAGDVLTDASGAWKPAIRAVNDATGESLVLDGGGWKPMPGTKAAPSSDTVPSAGAPGPQPPTSDDPIRHLSAPAIKGAGQRFAHPLGHTSPSPQAPEFPD